MYDIASHPLPVMLHRKYEMIVFLDHNVVSWRCSFGQKLLFQRLRLSQVLPTSLREGVTDNLPVTHSQHTGWEVLNRILHMNCIRNLHWCWSPLPALGGMSAAVGRWAFMKVWHGCCLTVHLRRETNPAWIGAVGSPYKKRLYPPDKGRTWKHAGLITIITVSYS